MAVILAPIGGFIMAHPMATAAGVTAINAINYVFPRPNRKRHRSSRIYD